MCAIIAQFIRDLLDFAGLSSNPCHNERIIHASVLTRLSAVSNASPLKSREQKMVEINNQRKAFLDMLAWSEGTDNDVRKPETMVMTSL